MLPQRIEELYVHILQSGVEGAERFRGYLTERSVLPDPNVLNGDYNLYAPNPVIVPGQVVEAMVTDSNRFCDTLQRRVPNGATLLDRAPTLVRNAFASPEVAERVIADMRQAYPLTILDAFLTVGATGLEHAYIEWQTVATYPTMGRWMLEAAAEAWPIITEYSALAATAGMTLAQFTERLRALYLAGIEDDPRQGVVMDYLPHQQPTRQEFRAIRELTGGPKHGMAVIDPRATEIHNGQPHYRRDGKLIPIRRIYSRLVYSDMQLLHREATSDQRCTMQQLFADAENVSWISHPLHFFYGSKGDFPAFWEEGLSPALPECISITETVIQRLTEEHGADGQLLEYVQKPTDLQSGREVVLNPRVSQLKPGYILQRQIRAANFHQTIYGPRTPEVRLISLPGEDGRLIGGVLFTRSRAATGFLTNVGDLLHQGIPGTGVGYGIPVFGA